MSDYFDKDFFKFFLGFAAIISLSLVVIFATRFYEEKALTDSTSDSASVIQTIVKK